MNVHTEMSFADERTAAAAAVDSIAAGRGWCNVVPGVTEEAKDLTMNVFGLWVSKGVVVATFVTNRDRHGEAQPSSLGLLHTRGRLGRERIATLIGDAPLRTRQDHNQRGLLLDVPPDVSARKVLDVMCTLTSSLCDYELTGTWRLDLFVRQ
ncbi:MAG: hypothetical protein ABSC34_11590 [Acidimicrobiales bacterium]|jgi:hypothetical protein